MRLIVAGNRARDGVCPVTPQQVRQALEASALVSRASCVIDGACAGVDEEAHRWALGRGLHCVRFPGHRQQMATFAARGKDGGGLVLITMGLGAGSKSMLEQAQRARLAIEWWDLESGKRKRM